MAPGEGPRGDTVSVWRFLCVAGLTPLRSVSLGYFPPSSNYEKLEVFVKKFPIYKYQLYFSSTTCIGELERNVRITSTFGAVGGGSFTPVNLADREFLQILVSYQRLFGT